MIPGRFHAETVGPFDVQPGQTVTIPLIDQDGNSASEFLLPINDTDVDFEVSATELPLTVSQRANRMEFYIVRLKHDGTADDDRTGRAVRSVAGPTHTHSPNVSVQKAPTGTVTVAGGQGTGASGTTSWADTFSKHEFVNDDDGPFCIRVAHNGSGSITIGKVVVHATNPDAKAIYRHEGWNMYSDGVVRRENP